MTKDVTWGDLWVQNEREWSRYNFEEAPVAELSEMFKIWESEVTRLLDLGLVMPGYDAVIKCSHLFNLLDARGAISVSERVGYIGRVRKLARRASLAWAEQREALGYPLILDPAEREKWVKPKDAGDDGDAEDAGAAAPESTAKPGKKTPSAAKPGKGAAPAVSPGKGAAPTAKPGSGA